MLHLCCQRKDNQHLKFKFHIWCIPGQKDGAKNQADRVLVGQKTVAPMQGEGVAKVTPSHPSIATFPLPTPHNSKNPPPPPWVAIYRSYLLSMPSSQITQPISLVKHPKERVQRGFAGMYLFPRSKSFLLVLLQSIQSQHVSKPYHRVT